MHVLVNTCARKVVVRTAMIRLALILTFIIAPCAFAGNSESMQFSIFWPCYGNNYVCVPAILAEGDIERDTADKLSKFLSDSGQHPHKLSPGARVCFNSSGGDLLGALQLGRLIRNIGFNTCLAPGYARVIPGTFGEEETFVKDAVCASACAFAFLGGVNRAIEPNSLYGIHQFYGTAGNIGDSVTQITIVALAAYIEEMGSNRHLLDAASLVPSHEMYWLSLEDLRELRVDNMTVDKSKWQLSALQNGGVIATIKQVKPGFQNQISLALVKGSDHVGLIITFIPNERYSNLDEALLALNGSLGETSLYVDDREVATYKGPTWKRGKGMVGTVVHLSPLAVQALRSGKMLDLRVNVARVSQVYDPSLEFPLDGLGHLLNAVLR